MEYINIFRGEVKEGVRVNGIDHFIGDVFLPTEFEKMLVKASERMEPGKVYEVEIKLGVKCLGAAREETQIPHRSEVSRGDFFDFDSELCALEAKRTAKKAVANAGKAVVTAGRLLKKEGAAGEQE